MKAVLKGIPLEFETQDIKLDLERQGYSVLVVHRIHRRDGTALGISLKHHTDEASRVSATAVSSMVMRRRTAMLNGDVISAWSHTRPRTTIAIENRVMSLPVAIAGRITQRIMESARLHPNCLNSDHRPVLMRLGSLTGDYPLLNKTITNWQKMLTVLEEIDIPILNNIPNDILSTDDIDNAIAKALKTKRAVPVPALRKPDKSVAIDDREKAECLADSIKQQRSENPPYDFEHVRRVEVRHRVFLLPKDDLDPIVHDKISKKIKALKIRKALAWKEAVVIGIPKPEKSRDLLASYYLLVF
ncbi:hypothetical protein EVAR_85732_1 [Eumeta japonica]|uniref:Uncharacterized protein n=1 Tax=Eumeta variegata TaxID=151549 RepID=A0A4C1Y4Q1_EUMVA|nr:hypothetical protein EVAR_85732_1 [Eumeta japonica]